MFATYSLNICRLLTQSIRRRPNLHVKSEHLVNIPRILVSLLRYVYRTIAEYSLAVRKNCSRQCIFFLKGPSHWSGQGHRSQCLLKEYAKDNSYARLTLTAIIAAGNALSGVDLCQVIGT